MFRSSPYDINRSYKPNTLLYIGAMPTACTLHWDHVSCLHYTLGPCTQPALYIGVTFPACTIIWGHVPSLHYNLGPCTQPALYNGAIYPACTIHWGHVHSLHFTLGHKTLSETQEHTLHYITAPKLNTPTTVRARPKRLVKTLKTP